MHLTKIQLITVWILPILFAITVHEVAHGYVAYLLGDKTAKMLGRLTLIPIKHIDICGTIIVPLVMLMFGGVVIGWAKPVPITSRNLRKPRRDMLLISLAGPLANLVMALIWAGIAKLAEISLASALPGALAVYMMGMAGIMINLMLMILNLLPIPPLDGSHVIAGLLPAKLAYKYEKMAVYGFIIVLILFALGILNLILQPVVIFMLDLITSIFGLSLGGF